MTAEIPTQPLRYRHNGQIVTLPSGIFVHKVTTLSEHITNVRKSGRHMEALFDIWLQLARVLRMFHHRGWYVRDIVYDNVVLVKMGGGEGWTFLEFGNTSRERRHAVDKGSLVIRQIPPEVCPVTHLQVGLSMHECVEVHGINSNGHYLVNVLCLHCFTHMSAIFALFRTTNGIHTASIYPNRLLLHCLVRGGSASFTALFFFFPSVHMDEDPRMIAT